MASPRPASSKTTASTVSECLINSTRCSAVGAYDPGIQFLAVRSLAPVHRIATYAALPAPPSSWANAELITCLYSDAETRPAHS